MVLAASWLSTAASLFSTAITMLVSSKKVKITFFRLYTLTAVFDGLLHFFQIRRVKVNLMGTHYQIFSRNALRAAQASDKFQHTLLFFSVQFTNTINDFLFNCCHRSNLRIMPFFLT
jgi:hypothetical protein